MTHKKKHLDRLVGTWNMKRAKQQCEKSKNNNTNRAKATLQEE